MFNTNRWKHFFIHLLQANTCSYIAAQNDLMQFQLTEEQQMIRQAARDFARSECLPGVIERDELQNFPKNRFLNLLTSGLWV